MGNDGDEWVIMSGRENKRKRFDIDGGGCGRGWGEETAKSYTGYGIQYLAVFVTTSKNSGN